MKSEIPSANGLAKQKEFGWSPLAVAIKLLILGRFFKISLTTDEYEVARSAVVEKYAKAISQTLMYSLLLVPALLLLDTQIVISVVVPSSMVAGTAWFAVSLASMKKKFEQFGMELTADLFIAFTLSLSMLFLSTAASLTKDFWAESVSRYEGIPGLKPIAAALAILVVGRLAFAIFAGSLKYDINDAMLTGQNEAAERFFRKSLSLLHSTSELLRTQISLQVANYSIGVAFYEVFTIVRTLGGLNGSASEQNKFFERCNLLIRRPSMEKEEADKIAVTLIEEFVSLCSRSSDVSEHKSYIAVRDEIECLKKNDGEDYEMIDTRMSVVLSEISNLIEELGQRLFEGH